MSLELVIFVTGLSLVMCAFFSAAQVALFFGANDLGGTMLEENVVAAAGCSFRMSQQEVVALARGAGFIPARRTTEYLNLEEY